MLCTKEKVIEKPTGKVQRKCVRKPYRRVTIIIVNILIENVCLVVVIGRMSFLYRLCT